MGDSNRDVNRIPKEQLTAYERWELPLLNDRGHELTRDDGYTQGRDQGYQDGLEAGREEGRRQGLETGKAEGQTRGYEDSQKEIDVKLDRLEHLLGELLLPISRHRDDIETALVNLTTVLARAVVYRELTIDSSQIRHVVRRALEALPSTVDTVRIRIHPDDCDSVREVADRMAATSSLIEDTAVLPGGCTVETCRSLVDFTVEKRLQRAVESMLEPQPAGTEGDGDAPESC